MHRVLYTHFFFISIENPFLLHEVVVTCPGVQLSIMYDLFIFILWMIITDVWKLHSQNYFIHNILINVNIESVQTPKVLPQIKGRLSKNNSYKKPVKADPLRIKRSSSAAPEVTSPKAEFKIKPFYLRGSWIYIHKWTHCSRDLNECILIFNLLDKYYIIRKFTGSQFDFIFILERQVY